MKKYPMFMNRNTGYCYCFFTTSPVIQCNVKRTLNELFSDIDKLI